MGIIQQLNPAVDSLFAQIEPTKLEHLNAIIKQSNAAADAWKNISPTVRANFVMNFGMLLVGETITLVDLSPSDFGRRPFATLLKRFIATCECAAEFGRGVDHVSGRIMHHGVVFSQPEGLFPNGMPLALVSGNAFLWKPSLAHADFALKVQEIFEETAEIQKVNIPGLLQVIIGADNSDIQGLLKRGL